MNEDNNESEDNETETPMVPVLHPPAPPERMVAHLQALARPSSMAPPPRPPGRIFGMAEPLANPELERLGLLRQRHLETLAADGKLQEDARLGDAAPVPRVVQPAGLPTRAPKPEAPLFDNEFFKPNPRS